VLTGIADPQRFEPFVFYSFTVMFAVFGTAVLVISEYVQTVRTQGSWWQRARGLSLAELRALLHWCPRWLAYLSLAGAVAGFLIMLPVGTVDWSDGQPFTEREALGFTTGLSIFCFLALPVLGSASRMPGTFSVHYGT
jgi:hypothetical protein